MLRAGSGAGADGPLRVVPVDTRQAVVDPIDNPGYQGGLKPAISRHHRQADDPPYVCGAPTEMAPQPPSKVNGPGQRYEVYGSVYLLRRQFTIGLFSCTIIGLQDNVLTRISNFCGVMIQ